MALVVLISTLAGCTGDTDRADETIIEDVYGCTNPDALNYDEHSTKDDSSCTFESDTGEVQDNLEADDCSNSTMNNTNTPVTKEDVQEEYNFSEMLEPMGALGSYDAQIGLNHNHIVIGDTIYFILEDLWSFNIEDGLNSHAIDGIQFIFPEEIVEIDDVLYFSAEEVLEGERSYEYATFAHDLSNSTTWRISDDSHLNDFQWGGTFKGHDFFLSNKTIRVMNDDGTSTEVYNHTQGVWCQSCGEVGVTEHGIVFVASDGDETGNHLELWLLNLDSSDDDSVDGSYSTSITQLTDLNLSDNYNTMFLDILSITDEAVVFATMIGWSNYYYLNQYSFDNQTTWQVYPDQVNLNWHRDLQGYGATNSEILFIPEWDDSTGQSSVLIYNSCVGSIYNQELGPTSNPPNTYITEEELIITYRPLNSSNDYSPITHVVGMSQMTGEIRNITTFDQSELLNSTTEAPGRDGGVVVYDRFIFLRAWGQLLIHDTELENNWISNPLSQTIDVKYFQCDNGEQILFSLVNSYLGIEDCSDGSDEVDWDESNNPGFPGNFTCDDGTELEFWDVNNGWHQCSNGEDEWYPEGFMAMSDGWDLLVLGDSILFRSGWDAWYLEF
ncbi:MAG: low-density lipoprotein receptor class A repeat-containing protein [archaeon]|nr:low-density lipoprotein receptor class A repeat-containing protein [archaeon]